MDITPELYDEILNDFKIRCSVDMNIKAFEKGLEMGTADQVDASKYARRLGEIASAVLRQHLTPEAMPDGTLYWNIADRTISPLMMEIHEMVNEAAKAVQIFEDEKAKIGLRAVSAEYPNSRVHALIQKVSDTQEYSILAEPISNIAHSLYDDFVEANVSFREKAGLKTSIIRRPFSKCCEWCEKIAGIYDGGDPPKDIYRRHDNCRCMVVFKSEKTGYKDMRSQKEFKRYRDARIARIKELEQEK